MAELRDLNSGKIYIGPTEPQTVDQSLETLDGGKPFDGTLAAVGPVFLGEHSDIAAGHVNIGTGLGIQKFKPLVKGLALSVEGDVEIAQDPFGDNFPNAVIIQGDVKIKYNNGEIIYAGNPFEMDFNDIGDQKLRSPRCDHYRR